MILAILAVHVEGTRSGAGLAVPSHLARALSGPWIAQLCVVVLAFADLSIGLQFKISSLSLSLSPPPLSLSHLCAIGSVKTVVTSTLTAFIAYPAQATYASAVSRIAGGIVFTGTIICAVQSERIRGTDLQTLFSVCQGEKKGQY